MQILLDNSRHVWSKTFHTEERIAAWSAKNVRVVRSGCLVYKISPLFKKSLIFFPEFKEAFAFFKSLRVEIYKKKKEKILIWELVGPSKVSCDFFHAT